jgi:hypothetical protein
MSQTSDMHRVSARAAGEWMVDTGLKFVFDPARLTALADRYRADYTQARPFPHVVIEDFLPLEALRAVLAEFPRPDQVDWIAFNNPAEKKLATRAEAQMGAWTRFLLYQFNSSIFLSFLESLTGIRGLIPDPHFWGGGLHQIERGGFLKIHADFTRHPILPLDRRLNLLLYLNEDWPEEYGGQLELWDRGMIKCEARILPVFNRCVIFSTTAFSFHGHPDPVACPAWQTRKSIALYYFSNGRPEEEHPIDHGTLFVHRPGEAYKAPRPDGLSRAQVAKKIIKRLLPPILIDAVNSLRPRL